MRCSLSVALAVLLIAVSACYHATIDTGLTPSTVVVDKSWAAGWLWGLVPPSTVETATKCKSGVAKVETKLSFLNQLVNAITLGIYTPMAIKATCAQSGHASISPEPTINVGAHATPEEIQNAIARAATLSLREGVPVYVEY
jgi:Bor protein